MLIAGKPHRTIWCQADGSVRIIDQTRLPHELRVTSLESLEHAAQAISKMQVRGAPLIGATAAYGIALAMRDDPSDACLSEAATILSATRPTAVNLAWAIDRMVKTVSPWAARQRAAAAFAEAGQICDRDVDICEHIGVHGLEIIRACHTKNPGRAVNILTHCNAGWLATIDWGTATAPIYKAQKSGIPVHVWVDETRPRNQGAALTCFELGQQGIDHTLVTDNAGGHLMQHGEVDMVITGTDRTAANGDVANKIGTYLKALAARDNDVPFYVALPSTTIDWGTENGRDIPIENRNVREVTHVSGKSVGGVVENVQVCPDGTAVSNPAFDVTPARLVTKLITERGICEANREGLLGLFPGGGDGREPHGHHAGALSSASSDVPHH